MDLYSPRSPVVSTTVNEDESVLLHLERQQYYALNETGSRIWRLLTEGHSTAAIAAAIAKEWAISETEARRHVRAFLRELRTADLWRRPARTPRRREPAAPEMSTDR
jgi:DNA-binding CsgD family transcriptional regulator